MKRIILFILVPIICFAQDILYVTVSKNSIDNIKIVISSAVYKTDLEKNFSEKITNVVEANLLNSGLFKVKRATASQVVGDISLTINLSKFSDQQLELSFSLFDLFMKKELMNKTMILYQKDWRKMAHLISDMIYSRLIGEKGHFNTKITYIAEERGQNNKCIRKIVVMDQDGSNVKYLTNGDRFVSTPRFSPNGENIVYISYYNGRSYIILKNLKNNTESVVSAFEGVLSGPRFAPDGKSLLVCCSSGSSTNILSLDLANHRISKITNNTSINTSPSFSPDQNYIVFSSDSSGSQQLYIMNMVNQQTKRISSNSGNYSTPVWSPNGDLVAFTKSKAGKFYIGVMKPDGKKERLLSEGYKIESPAWLPNGREMIFTKTEPSNISQLCLIDLFKQKHKIISTQTNAFLADWSHF
ncbi:protein TolB [Wolbachia pipientis]|uniref:Protein TolB n=1 Tax=Wolbachia pipientis TaxID=955 RepID=A0A1E7QJF4_WOLPI|nr:Tol-Pal system protein TolB [Wolbachia pipientis]OEY86598.1 protein TolB [Wolbachia pipientis]